MSGCEQFSDWEVVTNLLKNESGVVWPIVIVDFSSCRSFGTVVLEGYFRVLVMERHFVLDSAGHLFPNWLYFPRLSELFSHFFQDENRAWLLDVLGQYTNRRKSVTHLVWVKEFECGYGDAHAMLRYLDYRFRNKRCLFLIDREAFDDAVWEHFSTAGFDDMGGSRFGVCGRLFPSRWPKIRVRFVGG